MAESPVRVRAMRDCARCGAPFAVTRPNRRYCDKCKTSHHHKRDAERAARRAGTPVIDQEAPSTHLAPGSSPLTVWCSTCLSTIDWDGGTACPVCGTPWPRRRASRKLRLRIADRDGWICHRCRFPIDPDLPYRHPLALIADHFPVSLSDGGPTIAANLKAAHSLCNGSHLGLETLPEETVHAMLIAGLIGDRRDGSGKFFMTPEGQRVYEELKREGNSLSWILVRAAHFQHPHWWNDISDSERSLAAEILKLPRDRDGTILPPDS